MKKDIKRVSISKKTRFEVFKRDSFKCCYCGKSAPEIVLEIDHIEPICKGGDNSIFNLITSCFDCNRGKKGIRLNDSEEIKKQKEELDKLNIKKEQLQFLKKWRDGLKNIEDDKLEYLHNLIKECCNNTYKLNDNGTRDLKNYISKYEFRELQENIIVSFNQYYGDTSESFDKALNYIPKIILSKRRFKDNPELLKNISYCNAIIRNKSDYSFNKIECFNMLKNLFDLYNDFNLIKNMCCNIGGWDDFIDKYNDLIKK